MPGRERRRVSTLPGELAEGRKGAALQEILESYVAELEPGSALPSERELAERFGVARMTVRAQIERMAHRRLVYRQQGRGTFVAERRLAHTEHLTSFTEDMQARGLVAGARMLGVDTLRAGRGLAARLEVPAGSRVARIRRVRTADGVPMAVEQTHLPARRFPGLADEDLATRSLYELLAERYDVTIAEAVQRVTVTTLQAADAELLETPRGEPAFQIERITRDGDGVVIEFAASIYRGDRYEVLMHARRDPPAALS
ncbi:MAG: GntR family transcriptional regulator [Actinomycetota bacterium]|nr:GntR family transcriptional regulator [Actinomycetota bacterium]